MKSLKRLILELSLTPLSINHRAYAKAQRQTYANIDYLAHNLAESRMCSSHMVFIDNDENSK